MCLGATASVLDESAFITKPDELFQCQWFRICVAPYNVSPSMRDNNQVATSEWTPFLFVFKPQPASIALDNVKVGEWARRQFQCPRGGEFRITENSAAQTERTET